MEDMINVIANVGFPIAIALYLLVRGEQKLEALTMSITELSHNINTLCEKVNNQNQNKCRRWIRVQSLNLLRLIIYYIIYDKIMPCFIALSFLLLME